MMISIIMPVYNNPKYLHEAVKSVINQSDGNWELILVNDGSTDNTGNICNEYAKKDSRIKVKHIKNSGPANARNTGLQLADGEYCTFLDSDDLLNCDAIKILQSTVHKEEFDIIFFGYYNDFYNSGNKVKSIEYKLKHDKYYSNESFKKAYKNLNEKGFSHPAWNKMFRTKFLKKNNILFPYGIYISEDYIFNLKAYISANKILIIEDGLYHYNTRNSGSITTSFKLSKIKDMVIVYEKSYKMIEKWNPSNLNNINNEFIGNVSVYINSLYNKDCNLSESNKKEIVSNILHNESVLACITEIIPNSLRNKIMVSLLKLKIINLLLLTGKIARIIK